MGREGRWHPRRLRRAALRAAVGALATWLLLAYVALPAFWRHRLDVPPEGLVTATPLGIPGDPVNLAFAASEADLLAAFAAAGWTRADPLSTLSGARIAADVLLDRPYPAAPVSTLLLDGRPQDMAFERAAGRSPQRRHHVRLWRRPGDVWLGAASYDEGVELSRETLAVTHAVAPDLDAERDGLERDLRAAGWVAAAERLPGVDPRSARNGGGDPYDTDGALVFLTLAPPSGAGPPGAQAPLPP